MRPTTLIALANRLEKMAKPLKGNLTPGVHLVDETVTIKVSGQVTRGEDTTYTPTAEIPILATLAIFIEKTGIVSGNVAAMLAEAMNEAYEYNSDADGYTGNREAIEERLKDIDATMERVRTEITDKLPEKDRNGSTTVKVTMEEATFKEVAAA
jgi:hypothetical protein